jgi:hypothetical protein
MIKGWLRVGVYLTFLLGIINMVISVVRFHELFIAGANRKVSIVEARKFLTLTLAKIGQHTCRLLEYLGPLSRSCHCLSPFTATILQPRCELTRIQQHSRKGDQPRQSLHHRLHPEARSSETHARSIRYLTWSTY